MGREKTTFAKVKKDTNTQVPIRCLESHSIKYTTTTGRVVERKFKRGDIKKRRNVRILRPSKWELA